MNQKLNEVLKSLREKAGLSKEELANILKTTIAQIEVLEKGDFSKLPKINLVRIIEKYEQFFKVELKNLIIPQDLIEEEKTVFKSNSYKFNLLHPLFYFLIVVIVFIFFQLFNLVLPPKINVLYPYDGLTTNQRQLIIRGYVDPRSVFYLNNKEIIFNENGYFQTTAFLRPGLNKFEFFAKNYLGISRKIIINVYYQPY